MSQKTNSGAATQSEIPATQEAMEAAEKAFLNELAQLMQAWYDQAGPGIDVVFYALNQLLAAGDKAAAAFDDDFDDAAIPARWSAIQAMRGALPIAWPLSITRARELRKKMLKRAGGIDGAPSERRTLALVAADIIPVWYAKAGLWGALASLNEDCKLVFEVFTGLAEDRTVPDEDKLHHAALEVRYRLGKVSEAELEMLEALSEKAAT